MGATAKTNLIGNKNIESLNVNWEEPFSSSFPFRADRPRAPSRCWRKAGSASTCSGSSRPSTSSYSSAASSAAAADRSRIENLMGCCRQSWCSPDFPSQCCPSQVLFGILEYVMFQCLVKKQSQMRILSRLYVWMDYFRS